jgi:hypothetical protein
MRRAAADHTTVRLNRAVVAEPVAGRLAAGMIAIRQEPFAVIAGDCRFADKRQEHASRPAITRRESPARAENQVREFGEGLRHDPGFRHVGATAKHSRSAGA